MLRPPGEREPAAGMQATPAAAGAPARLIRGNQVQPYLEPTRPNSSTAPACRREIAGAARRVARDRSRHGAAGSRRRHVARTAAAAAGLAGVGGAGGAGAGARTLAALVGARGGVSPMLRSPPRATRTRAPAPPGCESPSGRLASDTSPLHGITRPGGAAPLPAPPGHYALSSWIRKTARSHRPGRRTPRCCSSSRKRPRSSSLAPSHA